MGMQRPRRSVRDIFVIQERLHSGIFLFVRLGMGWNTGNAQAGQLYALSMGGLLPYS